MLIHDVYAIFTKNGENLARFVANDNTNFANSVASEIKKKHCSIFKANINLYSLIRNSLKLLHLKLYTYYTQRALKRKETEMLSVKITRIDLVALRKR